MLHQDEVLLVAEKSWPKAERRELRRKTHFAPSAFFSLNFPLLSRFLPLDNANSLFEAIIRDIHTHLNLHSL